MLNYAFVLIILNLFIYYAVSGQIRLNCQVMWRKGIAHPNFFFNIGNEYCTCLLKPIVCLPLSTKRFRVAECLSCSFPWNESQWWPQLSNVFKENMSRHSFVSCISSSSQSNHIQDCFYKNRMQHNWFQHWW